MSREKRLDLKTFQIDQHSELDIIQEDMHVLIIYVVTQKQAVEEVGGSVCGGVVCVCVWCVVGCCRCCYLGEK